ncbi:MAG: peptidoglycan-associated lipoprotein Pal [Vicinamibacterales bacterium]
MNVRRLIPPAVAMLLVAMVVTGCARNVPPPAPPPPEPPPAAPAPPPPPPPPPAPAPPPPPRQLSEDELFQQKTLDQLNAERPLSDVFFDYDMSTLRDDARATLERNANYLRRWPTTRVTIEGHADSRGTNEYNLALGERRAVTVRDYLVGLGIAADRMLAISKGEETPVCMEDNESCWSQNRRGHFIFTAK